MRLNRNKRSIVLDLVSSAKDVLWRQIVDADVFLHSIRPQAIGRLGFGHYNVSPETPDGLRGVHAFAWMVLLRGPPMTT